VKYSVDFGCFRGLKRKNPIPALSAFLGPSGTCGNQAPAACELQLFTRAVRLYEWRQKVANTKNDKHVESARLGASQIKTLRISVRPGASPITQLAAVITGRRRRGSVVPMTVAGFFFPYFPGFPVLAYPGRRSLAPAYPRKSAHRP
jgi:hypothetical protein